MDEDMALKVDPGAPPAPIVAPEPKHRVRRAITWVLVVVFAILTPITLVSAWAVRTVTNTDRYVTTMQPLVHDPVITNFVADKATAEIFSQFHLQQQISSALPSRVSFIAAPITAQLKTFTQTQFRKVTSSQWFAKLWEKENHLTQAAAIAVLTGQERSKVKQAQGLGVQVTPVILKGINELDARGVTAFNPLKTKIQNHELLKIELIASKQVDRAQWFFNLAIQLRWALLIGTPLIGIVAIAIAVERRRAALRIALAGIVGCLVAVIGMTVGRQEFVNAVGPDYQLVATHTFDIVFRFLRGTVRWTLGVFVVLAVIFWLIGDSTWAVALRRAVGQGTKKLGAAAEDAAQSDAASKAVASLAKAGRWLATVQAPARWLGVIVAGIFALTNRTINAVIWTLVLLALYQVLISVILWWSSKQTVTDSSRDAPSTPSHDAEINA